jgi:hypothetical protein
MVILCIATHFKGDAFLRECRRLGCTVILITADSLAGEARPHEAIDEIHTIPRDADAAHVRRTVDPIARQDEPDMSGYADPEIVAPIRKHHHAGLIVRSENPERIDALLDDYSRRFYRDFFASAPAPDRPHE